MSTRKYASGYEKLKKRRKEEKLIESQKGSMDKFVISNKQNIIQNLDENITNEQELEYKNLISQFAYENIRKIDFKLKIL